MTTFDPTLASSLADTLDRCRLMQREPLENTARAASEQLRAACRRVEEWREAFYGMENDRNRREYQFASRLAAITALAREAVELARSYVEHTLPMSRREADARLTEIAAALEGK